MKISVRFEGGLGDHILANRFTPAILEKYPGAEIHLYSDTNGSNFQSSVVNKLFNYYKTTTLLERKSDTHNILSQFGKENFPTHINNINDKQKAEMLSHDKFYNLHIDWMAWMDYDFHWQKYFSFFPAPQNPISDYEHQKPYILLHIASDNRGNNHRMSKEYINNIIKKCAQDYDVLVLSTPTTKDFIDKVVPNNPNVHIINKDIQEVISICKSASGIFAIDSAIKYFGYTFNVPTLCWAKESSTPHSCPTSFKMRWLTFPLLMFPLEYDHNYIWETMSNLINNNNNIFCPHLQEPDLSNTLIRRRLWT